MKNKDFKPTPTPIVLAMWEMLGRLTVPNRVSGLIQWGEYIRSGGTAKYLGRGRGY